MNIKLIYVGIFIGVLTLIVILLMFNPLDTNKYNQNSNPIITATPTTSLQHISFTGFPTYIILSDQTIGNVSSITYPNASVSAYTAATIDSQYLVSAMNMKKDTDLGVWENNQYILQPLPDGSLHLILRQTAKAGSLNTAQATLILQNFLTNSLGIDGKQVILSSTVKSGNFSFSGNQEIENTPVINFSGMPSIQSTVSTSGQILSVLLEGTFHSESKLGTYPTSLDSFSSVFSPYSIGIYPDDSIYIQNEAQNIANSSLVYSSTSFSYYYDSVTGSILPVMRIKAKATGSAGNEIGLTIVGLLINQNYITQVVVTPTPLNINGYNPF